MKPPVTSLLFVVTLVAAGGCGGDEPKGEEAPERAGAAPIVRQYREGKLSRADFAREIAALPPGADEELRDSVDGVLVLRARAAPHVISADVTVGPSGTLVIEAGASVSLGRGVTIDVRGNLLAIGAPGRAITIAGAGPGAEYKTISLVGGASELAFVTMAWAESLLTVKGTGTTPIVLEESKLDNWKISAVEMDRADGLVIRKNQVGLETAPEHARSEALHGMESAVRIEGNVFGRRTGYNDVFDLQPCKAPHNPVIVGNRFLGGDDDAIDLDNCDAIIVGNYLTNFRPDPATAYGQANGGGVTGEGDSSPFIANNIIENCGHAIGFKDRARPLIVNNTILDNDVGITMYSAMGLPAADGIAINNVLWGNGTDVILNGSWYVHYDPTTTGTLEASFNVTNDPALGGRDGNTADDPRIERRDGLPFLAAGSPARRVGQGDLATLAGKSIFPAELLRTWLEKDYAGNVRPFAAGRFADIDRGALQHR